jgi:glycerophosphoryl diester phosphodiesterase
MHRALKIGHRGAAGHAPENTLAAIRKGIDLHVDFIEIDLRCTADGALVALHDSTVNRTTNGKGRVDRLSLRDIKLLDAGNGESIPTLDEVLDLVRGQTGLMLELKIQGLGQMTVEAVQRAGWHAPVIYASFLHGELAVIRSIDAKAALMPLFGRRVSASAAIARRYGASHIGLRHDTVTRRLVEALHAAGLSVSVYTADDTRDIQRVLSLGVDGVISNLPERIA